MKKLIILLSITLAATSIPVHASQKNLPPKDLSYFMSSNQNYAFPLRKTFIPKNFIPGVTVGVGLTLAAKPARDIILFYIGENAIKKTHHLLQTKDMESIEKEHHILFSTAKKIQANPSAYTPEALAQEKQQIVKRAIPGFIIAAIGIGCLLRKKPPTF